ncbi:hypothetical protein LMH87_006449 [Akanthomyces muscarius]|uniref:Copper acquisition factor BIM1-like domain-containing protein n=2 Tax=Akanthomyces TaxID=150366 RepID=A0A168K750_CORDF|nr:hypothetical protein LMH87_006449 [Akanthomyces muscarius]KAJ4164788.1 hypothetical protein LMH87_006449 [Akanthomyces muscarius]OAA81307.1 hypothetical protein LEL_00852 [Akanthomyces lecanii RCEF 1005]
MLTKIALLLAASRAVTAHFGLTQPQWRADTLAAENEAKYSQWNYPCAGVPYGAGNTTEWPLDGGSLELDLHHPWTYVFVNLGLGGNTTNFNLTLTPDLWNTTGRGTFCVDKLAVPAGIADGTRATLQVVTSGASGSALYNCADIRFSKDAQRNSTCSSKGVTLNEVKPQGSSGGNASCTSSGTPAQSSAAGKSGAVVGAAVNGGMLATVAGAAALFALGSSL